MSNNTHQNDADIFENTTIPKDALWGKQTQLAIDNTLMSQDKTPLPIIRSYLILKKATTQANRELGILSGAKAKVILDAIETLLSMEADVMKHFPISLWQCGSGAQININVNEVIATLATRSGKITIDPHDDVNASQSSNDTFTTTLHMASAEQCIHKLMPAISKIRASFGKLETRYALTLKIGRTHLQDALPMTYGQMFSAYQTSLTQCMSHLHQSLDCLFELAIGGTEIGTGFGAPHDFDDAVAQHLSNLWKLPFLTTRNKFTALSTHTTLLHFMGCLNNLACTLNKIANDILLLGSGPRSGIGELLLPDDKSSTSMIPGKANPTQCEALSMTCMQVLGHYQSVALACANGQLELNAYTPLIGYNILSSIQMLSDAMLNFDLFCVRGLMVHEHHTRTHLERSLMLASVLSKAIGYHKSCEVANLAYTDNSSVKDACLKLKYLDADTLDTLLDPTTMIGNQDEANDAFDF